METKEKIKRLRKEEIKLANMKKSKVVEQALAMVRKEMEKLTL